ncbi:hypothetical protein B0A48_17242 [Cryoendolithus antarcticus]|uniref:Uncharacterized protein n=1 Tax=Cryoendolithus antarcticus TaxID=1507870 RepID=A0A1V8SDC5_9PEZI|nr:hypothetical protein B0A48_17242 [Cryoendolithus antarcticus]
MHLLWQPSLSFATALGGLYSATALPVSLLPAQYAPPPDFTNITLWPADYAKILSPSSTDLSPTWHPVSQQPPVYICYEANFNGDCVLVSGNARDDCLSMPQSLIVVPARSLRMGDEVECMIYNDHACTGSSIPISMPSSPDLHEKGWTARIKSLYCQALMVHARSQDLARRDAKKQHDAPRIGEHCWWQWGCLKFRTLNLLSRSPKKHHDAPRNGEDCWWQWGCLKRRYLTSTMTPRNAEAKRHHEPPRIGENCWWQWGCLRRRSVVSALLSRNADARNNHAAPRIGENCWWQWRYLRRRFSTRTPAPSVQPTPTVVQRHGTTAHIEQPSTPLFVPLPRFSYDPPKQKGRKAES